MDAVASEYIRQTAPHPRTTVDLKTPIDHAFFEKPLAKRFLWKGLKEELKDKPAFLRDTKLSYDHRTYYFARRNSSNDKPEALTTFGQIVYESGRWNNFGIRTVYYNSTEINSSRGDTGLLRPGQHNISVIGEANLSYKFTNTFLKDSEVRLYRQKLSLPYINQHDIRMLPAVHEAYTISRKSSSLNYIAGHIEKFKDYDQETFLHMSSAAGARGTSKGLSMVGARYVVNDSFSIGAIDYYGHDTFNTFYTEATYNTQISNDTNLRVSGQWTQQKSVGDDLVGNFDTGLLAGEAALGWRGAVFRVAASTTQSDQDIQKPWGGSPSYLSIQRFDFDRANENAFLLGMSYTNDYLSSIGLSGFAAIAHGVDAIDPDTGEDEPDQTEYNITIDYKPPKGFLEGLWFRARYNYIDTENTSTHKRDYRFILNYSLPFL